MNATRLPAGMAMPQTAVTISRSPSAYHLLAIRVIAVQNIGNEHAIKVWPKRKGQKDLLKTKHDLVQAPIRNKTLAVLMGKSGVVLLNMYMAKNVIGT